jgi:hypothetical protein
LKSAPASIYNVELSMRQPLIEAPRRGRPPKFGRPAQPVTITLPDDIVAALRTLDTDLSRSIVRLAELSAKELVPREPVELSRFGRSSVIVVKPVKVLAKLPGVTLVPLPDGRALISLGKEANIADFEISVRDAVDAAGTTSADRAVLESLADCLRAARQARDITLSERSIIVLERRRLRHNVHAHDVA